MEGSFCSKCGNPSAASPTPASTPTAPPATEISAPGLSTNLAGLLCYLGGFVTGIIFLVLAPYNRDKQIRFHAFQSIFLSVAWIVLAIVEGIITHMVVLVSWWFASLIGMLWMLVGLCFFLLWIVLMVKAYRGQTWKLPVIGDLAEKQA
jgi:uncharacterized membrane protein